MRYYLLAFAAFIVATALMYLIGAFTAASVDPSDWAPPARFILAFLDVACGVLLAGAAHSEAKEVRRLVRVDLADREASARWHRDWEKKK